jgi:hypothetical protein
MARPDGTREPRVCDCGTRGERRAQVAVARGAGGSEALGPEKLLDLV